MPQLFQAQLAHILDHLSIKNEGACQFAGEHFPAPPGAAVNPVFPHPMPTDALVRHLQSILYAFCYSRPFTGPPLAPPAVMKGMDHAFVGQLSAANRSREIWDLGWEIYLALADGRVYAKKGDRQHLAAPGEYIASGDRRVISQAGTMINLLQRREAIGGQPGFYHAYGEVPGDAWDDHTLLRFYFHIRSEGAPRLLEEISGALNAYEVPYQFKTLNEPSAYDRADASVLYLARRYYEITARLLSERRALLASLLKPEVPLFACKFMDGIGVADDPGNGESFGMHRCRLVAEGLADAFRTTMTTTPARIEAVRARFSVNGLDMEAPHLGPGLADYPPIPADTQEAA
jgi:hypothetical protein